MKIELMIPMENGDDFRRTVYRLADTTAVETAVESKLPNHSNFELWGKEQKMRFSL
jgi:hypothetical protein